jgi:hypothetical protein
MTGRRVHRIQVRAVFALLSSLGRQPRSTCAPSRAPVSSGGALETLPEFFVDALPALRGPSTASSSMRLGPRPTWSAHIAGDREDSACAEKRRTGIGKRSHSLRPCGTNGSRLASLMDRSTAKASKPMSSSSSYRRSSPATLSSWTISAATKAMWCAGPFVAARLLFLPRYSSSPQSYRAGVRQAENAAPKRRRANCRSNPAAHRSSA